jgi:hypothetical protein
MNYGLYVKFENICVCSTITVLALKFEHLTFNPFLQSSLRFAQLGPRIFLQGGQKVSTQNETEITNI